MSNGKRVAWEDYNANFVDEEDYESEDAHSYEDTNQDVDIDEAVDIAGNSSVGGIFKFSQFLSNDLDDLDDVIDSPFGQYRKSNKWAPFNFYELKLIHLYGFSSTKDKTLGIKLDNTDGVSAWRCIDPYCFIIAKAKLYEWKEVMANVEEAIGVRSPLVTLHKELIQKIISSELKGMVLIYPNGEMITSSPKDVPNDAYSVLYAQYEQIALSLKGCVLLENGEIKIDNR